jgi:hypothetical protein
MNMTAPGLAGWEAVAALIVAEDNTLTPVRQQLAELLRSSRLRLAPFHDPPGGSTRRPSLVEPGS